jgi:hypothetical protein
VRDKLILGAVRAAYADYLPRDRHPVVALFVTLAPQEVDANVHPAKTEVRFRNAGLVRALIVHALKDGLARDNVDDLVTGMRLLGARVLRGPDRHHGGLAQRSLLQDLEEPPPKPPNIHHGRGHRPLHAWVRVVTPRISAQ